ncbi:MAG: hypothetical protein ACLS3M_00865 [Collinsella sp.]
MNSNSSGEERLHAIAAARLAQGDADSNRKSIPFSDTVDVRFDAVLEAEATDPISDEELFE